MTLDHLIAGLKARRVGSTWMARCPAHQDRTPSLGIGRGRNGAPLVHCYAGCSQAAVLSALGTLGLRVHDRDHAPVATTVKGEHDLDQDRTRESLKAAAEAIWRASGPASGTPVERYLAGRGLTLPLPAALRYHPALRHPSGGRWPAMVALVTAGVGGEPVGIHRTFVARDGRGKAPVEPAKMLLGACRGGAVRLADATDHVMVGEGIESVLSVIQEMGKPGWAALSTSGLRALPLPETIAKVILLADGDAPGEAAAQDAARRWLREGRRVRIARPPEGLDFNDVLLATAPAERRVA